MKTEMTTKEIEEMFKDLAKADEDFSPEEITRLLSATKVSGEVEYDSVHRPSHYAEGRKYEPKDVIHDWKLSWNLGNAVKYIARCGRKDDAIEDLNKAIEYIKYEIEEMFKDLAK